MLNGLLPNRTPLQLTVRQKTRILFQGPVQALTSVNVRGKFDVLPEHANFISIITDYVVILKPDGSNLHIPLSRGVLKVDGNNVSVYLGVSPDVKTKTT